MRIFAAELRFNAYGGIFNVNLNTYERERK